MASIVNVIAEPGIAPPTRRAYRYPWRTMAVGDSFAVPTGIKLKSVYATAYARQHGGRKFSVRKLPDGTIRVWRVA